LFDEKRPSKGGKPVADPKSSSVLSGLTSEGLGRLLTKPHTGLFSWPHSRDTDVYGDNVEGQTETQEIRNQEDEPEVRDHTESREPNKERLESNQIKIDEVRTNGRQKVVNLSRILSPHQYCPVAPQKVLGDC
jgi:hypothetical protein